MGFITQPELMIRHYPQIVLFAELTVGAPATVIPHNGIFTGKNDIPVFGAMYYPVTDNQL